MKKRFFVVVLLTALVLTSCGKTEVTNAPEEVKEEVTKTVEEHIHEFVPTSNGDGTHTFKCTCGVTDVTEECSFDENNICSICGYEHVHNYELTANGNETHTYACSCGDVFTEDCDMVTDGLTATCSVCNYTKDLYTFEEMDKVMYVKSGVNVRTLPTTEGSEVLKTLSTNDEVHVIGKCNEDNWYKLEDNTFVHGNYLSDEKVVVQAQAPVETFSGNGISNGKLYVNGVEQPWNVIFYNETYGQWGFWQYHSDYRARKMTSSITKVEVNAMHDQLGTTAMNGVRHDEIDEGLIWYYLVY